MFRKSLNGKCRIAIVCLSIVFTIAVIVKYTPRIAEKIKIQQRESAKKKIEREISARRFQQASIILRRSNLTDDDKLRYGMRSKDYSLVGSLLDKSSLSPQQKLDYAVQMKDTHFIEALLQDSSLNTDKYLRLAIKYQNVELVKIFLENGANPNRDCPLGCVMREFSRDPAKRHSTTLRLIDLFVKYGANVDGDGETVPLCILAREYQTIPKHHYYETVAKRLLDHGADINGNGKSVPLIEALRDNSYRFRVRRVNHRMNSGYMFFTLGAQVDITDEHGRTPRSVASRTDGYGYGSGSYAMVCDYIRRQMEERRLREKKAQELGASGEKL